MSWTSSDEEQPDVSPLLARLNHDGALNSRVIRTQMGIKPTRSYSGFTLGQLGRSYLLRPLCVVKTYIWLMDSSNV